MIYSIFYAVLAVLALGILVFIHELGHYLMARREGMRVEAFSIGFGKPILSWKKDGVQWQLCWIPFGGYVKIAGMEKKDGIEPYQVEDGFYGKGPWSRIKVAFAGPLINIFLAFILFTVIWLTGGRDKPFSDCTRLVGWVDPSSVLYKEGLRPGSEIDSFGGKSFTEFKAIATTVLVDRGPYVISGENIDYINRTKTPFSYTLDLGNTLTGIDKVSSVLRMLSPANYLIYDKSLGSLDDSPMRESGIESGDRVVWVDGELVFSREQLGILVNQPKAFLTVLRGQQLFLTRIPRLHIGDLRLNYEEKAEFEDLSYAMKIQSPVSGLYFFPYNLTNDCVVQNSFAYLDEMAVEKTAFESSRPDLEIPLLPGDRIVAVDGIPTPSLAHVFCAVQQRHVQMVVLRGSSYPAIPVQQADQGFMQDISFADLHKLVSSIGTTSRIPSIGNLHLLKPILPKARYQFPLTYWAKDRMAYAVKSQKKQREGEDISEEQEKMLRKLQENEKQLMLGLPLQDRLVKYNPSPVQQMKASIEEVWRIIYSMVTGYSSPKYLAGPVGIVHMIHYGWSMGIKEVLFIVAAISFNLGIVNLLPIPILDGGHICFSLYELITRKRIKAKTMEKLIIPFIILFVAFFLYLTYQDLYRLLSRFF